MRFLHTADWHLGRIFYGVHLTEDQAFVLEQFGRLVADVKPDAVLIAGDVYDRAVPPPEAVTLLDEVLSRILLDHRVPVLLIAGNHDAPERLGFGRRLLARQGLHVVGRPDQRLMPVVIADDYGPVYFCPMPYAEPALVREALSDAEARDHDSALAALIARVTDGIPPRARRVALAHAFVAGGRASESERPLSVGNAGTVEASHFAPFHYAALGHLHQPQSAGGEHVRYAGSLLKYSFAEAGHRKSVTMVEMNAAGGVTWECIPLSPRRDVRCLDGCLEDILRGPRNGENPDDYLMVTLKDTGAILDAIGQLRAVYPNVLHIERPYLAMGGDVRGPSGDHRRQSEADLFASFFEQVTGDALSETERQTFVDVAEAVHRREREVGA